VNPDAFRLSFVRGLNKPDLKPEVYAKPLDLARNAVSKGWPVAAETESLSFNGE
jgi:hypothetical protein